MPNIGHCKYHAIEFGTDISPTRFIYGWTNFSTQPGLDDANTGTCKFLLDSALFNTVFLTSQSSSSVSWLPLAPYLFIGNDYVSECLNVASITSQYYGWHRTCFHYAVFSRLQDHYSKRFFFQ